MNNRYESKFQAGQFVRALRNIDFMYGEKHIRGEVYQIQTGEEAYYDVNSGDYNRVFNGTDFGISENILPK